MPVGWEVEGGVASVGFAFINHLWGKEVACEGTTNDSRNFLFVRQPSHFHPLGSSKVHSPV